jgi:hypothetical protein
MPKTSTNAPWTGVTCAGTCERTLRSRNYPAELAPDAAAHYARGMCAACDSRAKRVAAAVMDDVTRAHKADVDAWLDARRRRGVPAEGIQYEVAA